MRVVWLIYLSCIINRCTVLQNKIAMKSYSNQEIFKALSNRTRTKPQDIYSKMNIHLNTVQSQVLQFNRFEQSTTFWVKKQITKRGGSSRELRLKTLTEPKFQRLLKNCQLPGETNLKVSKLIGSKTQRAHKELKGLGNSSNAFSLVGFNSRLNPESLNKTKLKQQLQSTMIHTAAVRDSIVVEYIPKQLKMSVVDSIDLQPSEKSRVQRSKGFSNGISRVLKDQLKKKQKMLNEEWEKTDRVHKKIQKCIGQEQMRIQESRSQSRRLSNLMIRIRLSRPATPSKTQTYIRFNHQNEQN